MLLDYLASLTAVYRAVIPPAAEDRQGHMNMRTAAQLHVSSMGRTLTELSNAPFETRRLEKTLRAAGPPLLFGVRLSASVCLALYVAFWLEFDNPPWPGITAVIIVCQPQLGASPGKSWFRMVGTVVGSIAIVVLTACFPQDRALFLISLALWGRHAHSSRRYCDLMRVERLCGLRSMPADSPCGMCLVNLPL